MEQGRNVLSSPRRAEEASASQSTDEEGYTVECLTYICCSFRPKP